MTRRLLAAAVMVAVALPPSPRTAMAAAPAEPTAESLYGEGRTAYRLGKFEEAVEAWEKSYDLSNGNPLLLYNISLAYRGLFGITGDLKDLRQAEAVMKSFITVAEADTALQGELVDARARREEFLAEIAIEEEKPKNAVPTTTKEALAEAEARKRSEKRAKNMRLGGAITMGTGGAVFLTGAALGTFYVVKSAEFGDQVERDRDAVMLKIPGEDETLEKSCIDNDQVAKAALDVAHERVEITELPEGCRIAVQELADLGQTRINGKKANTLAIVGFAVIGGIGLAALIAGAVVFAQGNRISRSGKTARVQFSPTFGGRAGTGFMLHGRF